jgi:hypothetical protein
MDRRSVHRYVASTARVAGIRRPIGPHALRRTVGIVGLNRGIPLRTCSACFATPARGPPWAAMTSPGMPWNATPASGSQGLKQAFNIKSVGDLSKNKYFRAAQLRAQLSEAGVQ